MQFGTNKHLYIFQRPQIALAFWACAFLLVFEKFARAYLFQIALKIMWLPIQIALSNLTLWVIDSTKSPPPPQGYQSW